jgi:HEAT repeat protein
MHKRRLIALLVLLVASGTVALFPAPLYLAMGIFRHEAFFAGKPANYWSRALRHESFLGHEAPPGDAGKILREGGAAAVPVLCEIAQDPDDKLRFEALLALSLMGPEARSATSTLQGTIRDETESAKFLLAAETLSRIDPQDASEALSTVLRDKQDGSRRSWALATLLKFAPAARGALPVLEQMFRDKDESASNAHSLAPEGAAWTAHLGIMCGGQRREGACRRSGSRGFGRHGARGCGRGP